MIDYSGYSRKALENRVAELESWHQQAETYRVATETELRALRLQLQSRTAENPRLRETKGKPEGSLIPKRRVIYTKSPREGGGGDYLTRIGWTQEEKDDTVRVHFDALPARQEAVIMDDVEERR